MGKTRSPVVTADDDERVLALPRLFELFQNDADPCIPGGHLAEVVRHVFADLRDIGEKGRQLSLQRFRLDPPERLAAPLNPLAMDIRRTEPVGERLVLLPRREEVLEIPPGLLEENGLCLLQRNSLARHLRDVLGELIELATAFPVILLLREGRIRRRSRPPDLVRITDVISGLLQEERKARDRGIPDGATQDRAGIGAPEMLSCQECTAARRARGSTDVGVAKKNPFPRDTVEVRSRDDVIDSPALTGFSIDRGELPPVIGEKKKDVRFLLRCRRYDRKKQRKGESQQGWVLHSTGSGQGVLRSI